MAGKIIADQLEHSSVGVVDTKYVVNGSAKLTGNIQPDGTSNADASLNISSVTDGSAGINTIAATNAFSAALAVVTLGTNHDDSYNRVAMVDDASASSFICRLFSASSGALNDNNGAHSNAFFGDLA